MAQTVITRQEYMDWKRDKCTKALLEGIEVNCRNIAQDWSMGRFSGDDKENTKMLGMIEGLRLLANAIATNKALPIEEGEDA